MTENAPMLRPMTVADLVDEIFRLYRANFPLLFGVSAIVSLPGSIASLVLGFVLVGGVAPEPLLVGIAPQPPSAREALQTLPVLAVAILIALVTFPVLFGAQTAAVSARYLGRAITVGDALRRGLACYWRMVTAFVIVFAAVLALVLFPFVFVLGGALLFGATGGGAAILFAALTFVAFIVAIVGTIWLALTWSFIGQTIVLENVSVTGSLGRSRALASRSRWRIFGINLLLLLIGIVLLSVPSSLAAAILTPLPGAVGPSLSQLVAALAQAAFYPVQLGTLTLLYYDLRVRKEAFDLAVAAESLSAK